MNDAGKTDLIVAALIRRGDEVLLVRLREPANQGPSWVLPAGDVTPGELLLETLARRVREETGLAVQDVGRLLYTMHHSNKRQLVAWVFDVEVWRCGGVEWGGPPQRSRRVCSGSPFLHAFRGGRQTPRPAAVERRAHSSAPSR